MLHLRAARLGAPFVKGRELAAIMYATVPATRVSRRSNGPIGGARLSTSRRVNSVRLMKRADKLITRLQLRRVVQTPRTFNAMIWKVAPAGSALKLESSYG